MQILKVSLFSKLSISHSQIEEDLPINKIINAEDFCKVIDDIQEVKFSKDSDKFELSCTETESWSKEDSEMKRVILSRDQSRRNSIKNAINTIKLITINKKSK